MVALEGDLLTIIEGKQMLQARLESEEDCFTFHPLQLVAHNWRNGDYFKKFSLNNNTSLETVSYFSFLEKKIWHFFTQDPSDKLEIHVFTSGQSIKPINISDVEQYFCFVGDEFLNGYLFLRPEAGTFVLIDRVFSETISREGNAEYLTEKNN